MNGLGKIVKLIGYNFEKSESFLTLLEDSLKVRVSHAIKSKEPMEINIQGLLDLTEGMSVLGQKRPRLIALLKRILTGL